MGKVSLLFQMKLCLTSCFCYSIKHKPVHQSLLASLAHFSEDEVEALFELFRKLSSSLVDDGLLSKEEFQLGLFGNSQKQTLLANRLFQLFDAKRDGAIDFHEFVRALSVFHPKAAQAEKVAFSFQLYDICETGFIQRKEVKELVVALLDESDLKLTDDIVEAIVDKTFNDADTKATGRSIKRNGRSSQLAIRHCRV